ncbi:YveK family protein [Robertmurraya kyonggiensis]|uniref:Capsular biosynthesis protein n=1 Tax=Robertmurraya kyonggiensis TaxID=1037680 RepID=A0A4U1D006_9BACI|nr:Wzz/FepE/Etk N-terminal domain-containing protein [Robertmurraya kyonggiensis]TKC15492.1 capsular biosynthesis protein [Robertmurraya kyonggiensis]
MEESISIKDIFKILINRWKLLVTIPIFAALICSAVTYYYLTPVYQASTQILVNQKNSENMIDIGQQQSNISLINTYSVIIKSPAILEKVIENLNLSTSVEQLNKGISVGSQSNSQVFSLMFQHSDPEMAVKIVNSITDTFQKEVKNIMNVDNVSVLAKAEQKEKRVPVKPKPLLIIAAGVSVSLALGIGWALLSEYLDNTVKNSQEVDIFLALPVLGSIEEISKQKVKKATKLHEVGVETFGT